MNSKERMLKSWHLAIPPEVFCEKAGTSVYDYYHVPAIRLATHQRAREYFLKKFDHDIGNKVGNGLTSYWNATLFGAKIEYEDRNSQGVVQKRVLENIEDVRMIEIPAVQDIPNLPCYRFLLNQHDQMSRLTKNSGFDSHFGSFGFQGPFTTATILRGSDIMMDMITYPDLVKELLEKIVKAQSNVMTFSEKEFGLKRKSCGMGDDYAGLISPDMYGEFCYPYMKMLYDAYGFDDRSLHCETLKRGHHKYLNLLKIDRYDPGVNKDLSIEDILEECPGMFFTYNLFTVRDMVNGTPETISKMCEDYISRGAPGIMTEITVNTPEENINAFLNVMRLHESRKEQKEPEHVLPKD